MYRNSVSLVVNAGHAIVYFLSVSVNTSHWEIICHLSTVYHCKKKKKMAPIQPQLFAVTVVMSQLVSLFVDEATYEASLSHSQRYIGTVHVYVCRGKKGA